MFDPVEYINAPRWRQVSLGLDRIKRMMELLGNPQDTLKCIHVAGTNGKGSTCAFVESILRCAGYKTGLFTSPYIEVFEERIRVNGENIPYDRLTEITLRVKDTAEQVEQELGEHPTEFELMTAVGFVYFAEEKCDYCVIEVGLGGRLDSTNIITPVVSVITKIGLDHTAMLGDTIEKIAAEKAGIIKPGVPVVIDGAQDHRAFNVLYETTEEVNHDVPGSVEFLPSKPSNHELGLSGEYQKENAGIAVAVCMVLGIPHEKIVEGLKAAKWPGRFEKFNVAGKTVIIDGAHNPDGAEALAKSLEKIEGEKSAVFGILADKDYEAVLKTTRHLFDDWYLYEPSNPRALALDEIPVQGVRCASSVEALKEAIKKGHRIIVCFGSLYSIGELRCFLNSAN